MYVERLHNGVVWMQSDPSHHRLHTVFFLVTILVNVERQSMQRLASPEMHQFFLSFEMNKITSSNSVHYIYIYLIQSW